MISIIYIYKILVKLEIDFMLCMVGCGFYVVSFPTFYYTTIGYVDPVLIFLLTLGLYLILTNRWIFLVGVIFMGTFVKETVLILIITSAAYLFFNHQILTKRGLILPLMLFVYAIGYTIARNLIPVDPAVGWTPSIETLVFNISRLRSWLSFLLTFGIHGLLALFIFKTKNTIWFQEKSAETATLITGLFVTLLLFGYAMLSAYADGRFIWTSYPFSVPVALIVLYEMRKRRSSNRNTQSNGVREPDVVL